MGTGNSELFNRTRGSRPNNNLLPNLFSDISTDHQTQGQINIAQGKHGSYTEDINQNKALSNIDQLFTIMCYMLISKLAEIKDKKMLEFLSNFDNKNFLDSMEFLMFKEYFQNENIGTDYGYDAIRKFIAKYLSDSSMVFMKLRRNEWVLYVNKFLRESA